MMSKRKELELYIHIPYCVRKCDYCDFLSFSSKKEQRERYVDALIREIRSKKQWAENYQVTSVFIGGGTPPVLEPEQTRRFLNALNETFLIREYAEITTEMNPGTITREKLLVYKEVGINRISIGLQSANNSELKLLGRIHSYEDFLECYELARELGFTNINVDLMAAVPGQTEETYRESLEKVVALGPEHISAYSLIIEEGTPFYERYRDGGINNGNDSMGTLVTEEVERQIYKDTKRYLQEHGYQQYEISNYARPGYECKHNLGYWECREYLGLGLGAASLLNHNRIANTRDMDAYVKGFYEGTREKLTRDMEMEEYCFLGLRKTEGIEKQGFMERFGCNVESVYDDVIRKQQANGLLVNSENYLHLTDRGVDISNYVMSEFIL